MIKVTEREVGLLQLPDHVEMPEIGIGSLKY